MGSSHIQPQIRINFEEIAGYSQVYTSLPTPSLHFPVWYSLPCCDQVLRSSKTNSDSLDIDRQLLSSTTTPSWRDSATPLSPHATPVLTPVSPLIPPTMPSDNVPPFLQTAHMFNLRPASFSPIDLHLLGANIRSSFDRMTCALRGSPNFSYFTPTVDAIDANYNIFQTYFTLCTFLSVLPHGQQETVLDKMQLPKMARDVSNAFLKAYTEAPNFTPAIFERRPAYFSVDSGSAISLVPLSTLVNINVLTPVCPSNWCIRAARGTSLKVMGEVKLNIVLSGKNYAFPFVVVDDAHLPGDLLLGYNIMRKAEIRQQPDRDTVTHQGNVYCLTTPSSVWHSSSNPASTLAAVTSTIEPPTVNPTPDGSLKDDRTRRSPFAICTPAQDLQDRCHATTTIPNVKTSTVTDSPFWAPQTDASACIVTTNLTLPPFTDSMVPVRVTSTDGTVLINPDCIRVKGLFALPLIYEVTNGTSALRLINPTCTPVRLRRETRVCDCEVTGLPVVEVEPPIAPVCNTSATTSAPDAPGPEETLCEFPPMDFVEDVLRRLLKEFPSLLPTNALMFSDIASTSFQPSGRLQRSHRRIARSRYHRTFSVTVDGFLRPIIDYRRLNAATVPDRYPIPTIRTLLQEVGEGHAIFSSIDLAHGFLQVEMDLSSKDLTTFFTPHGHFACTRMPFGFRNSPITFSRLMSHIMQGLIGDTAFMYLDDLLITSKNIADHERKLKLVFQRLADANLTIKVKKCQFFHKQTEYLGHTVDSAGLCPNDKKVQNVQNFPVPSTVTQVKAFLGLSGFYRPFIKKFGIIAEPLTRLLKKDALFTWT
ncbi:enzymatic polyprotein [Penaeus vannamei]|uniref:Enzymatic polyprotein n=1 Tax=Penaeus vannamei TaxID=6689 RepID=A0A3R7PVL9_PENVA|nr:enzymatic polyprotein [Penaeus vannamei]